MNYGLIALVFLIFTANSTTGNEPVSSKFITGKTVEEPLVIYKSATLELIKLSAHVYQHISYLQTDTFGKVACNGMVVINQGEVVVYDTTPDDASSAELISVISSKLNGKVKGVIGTHFHADCLGGVGAFQKQQIPVYISAQTQKIMQQKGQSVPNAHIFGKSFKLKIGNEAVITSFFGEGHTRDNVVGYFAADKAVFGGCLVKEMNASKGNLEDANVSAWAATVRKLKKTYPQINIVIPGHGTAGDTGLFDYTIQLFE